MKQKLIELLKTCDEVREDLEELRYGTYIEHKNGIIFRAGDCSSEKQRIRNNINVGMMKITGNPLEERHIRIYLREKCISRYDVVIGQDGDLYINNPRIFEDNIPEITQLDNTKSFDNQKDNVYEELYNFLLNNPGKKGEGK